jgi:hypothetical protein
MTQAVRLPHRSILLSVPTAAAPSSDRLSVQILCAANGVVPPPAPDTPKVPRIPDLDCSSRAHRCRRRRVQGVPLIRSWATPERVNHRVRSNSVDPSGSSFGAAERLGAPATCGTSQACRHAAIGYGPRRVLNRERRRNRMSHSVRSVKLLARSCPNRWLDVPVNGCSSVRRMTRLTRDTARCEACSAGGSSAARCRQHATVGSPRSFPIAAAWGAHQTLNLKCSTSPSFTTYSLPSSRQRPASLAPDSPRYLM